MKLPSILYGTYKAVLGAFRKEVSSVIKLQNWDVFSNDQMIDTENRPGLIVLNGPNPLLNFSGNFHVFVPLMFVSDSILHGNIRSQFGNETFTYFNSKPWGLFSLIATRNVMWVYPEERYKPFIEACLQNWKEINGINARFSNGALEGQKLWDVPNNIHYVLANMGISQQILRSPLPNDDLSEIV